MKTLLHQEVCLAPGPNLSCLKTSSLGPSLLPFPLLQLIQDSFAKLVLNLPKLCHVTPFNPFSIGRFPMFHNTAAAYMATSRP